MYIIMRRDLQYLELATYLQKLLTAIVIVYRYGGSTVCHTDTTYDS